MHKFNQTYNRPTSKAICTKDELYVFFCYCTNTNWMQNLFWWKHSDTTKFERETVAQAEVGMKVKKKWRDQNAPNI